MVLWFALLAAGCGQGGSQSGNEPVVGVSLLTRQDAFYRELERGLREEAARQKLTLRLDAGEFDLARQQSQLENYTVQKVAAIVVCPTDSQGIGPAIARANQAKIPVFTADIRAKDGQVVSHIASDNKAGGRLAGEYIARRLTGKGWVAIIDQPYIQSVIERVEGFEQALKAYPGIRIVARLTGDGVRDRSLKATEDLLQAQRKLDAVFAINDESAFGVLSALEAAGRKNVFVVGYDASEEARNLINKGDSPLVADVAQDPYQIGQRTIQAVSDYLAKKPVPPLIPVPVKLVERSTAAP
ncbi:periplasmic binding protein/LacI transcriptional regulator [Gloeobacter kilaueensis JS1]|uniref:Periplasmic binding protein/LacI transcriptional regulator n=2 Tax=Gloeobacter TaxID=33071 RepID=U5QPC6_GLOK1|nr:periplasmic binding protein/LacI transcriptional regulator [Gloeobacter kilaueensis JS1]